VEQVRDGDGFLAVRAEPAEPDPAAGAHALGAPLLAEVAGLALGALIDGDLGATAAG